MKYIIIAVTIVTLFWMNESVHAQVVRDPTEGFSYEAKKEVMNVFPSIAVLKAAHDLKIDKTVISSELDKMISYPNDSVVTSKIMISGKTEWNGLNVRSVKSLHLTSVVNTGIETKCKAVYTIEEDSSGTLGVQLNIVINKLGKRCEKGFEQGRLLIQRQIKGAGHMGQTSYN